MPVRHIRFAAIISAVLALSILLSTPVSAEALPKLWGLRPVGSPASDHGDDIGPPIPVQVQRYRESGATVGFTGMSWGQALRKDPGDEEPVYDFSSIERASFFFPDLENIAVIGLWCGWAEKIRERNPERYERLADHFVRACATHCNKLGIRFFSVAGNEYNLLNTTNWASMYVDHARLIYPSVKAVSEHNIVLAGNLSAGVEDIVQRLYDAGFKDYFDVMDIHCYSDHPRTGVSIEQVIATHRAMARNGDGHKLIFLGEGWGPGRSLPGVVREKLEDPISEAEIEGMRDFVVNGFRNLNTPKPSFDPAWILGASFFTLNDNMGGTFWRDRAVPIKDRDGNIIGYNLDGYRFPDWDSLAPRSYNGGIIDIYGNPKGDILSNFPPVLPPLTFRGWVLGPDGETQEAIPEAERLSQSVIVGREISVELLLENTGAEPILIDDLRLALKGEDSASLAIQPNVQDLVIAPEVEGLRVCATDPGPEGELLPGKRTTRRFAVLFPNGAGGKSYTLLGECDHRWKNKEYYADCWVPVRVHPCLEVTVKPERAFVTSARPQTSLWLAAANNTDASIAVAVAASAAQGIRVSVGKADWAIPPGENLRREILVSATSGIPPAHYPVSFSINGKTVEAQVDIVLDVPRVSVPVRLDGELSEWEEAPAIDFTAPPSTKEGEIGNVSPADLSSRALFLWDDEAFYVAFDVTDDVFWQEDTGMDVWRGDSVQIGFDTGLNALPSMRGYDQDDYEYTFAQAEGGLTVARYHGPLHHGPGILPGIPLAVRRDTDRTVYEITVPWEELAPFVTGENTRFAVSLLVNDNDGYGRKFQEWAGGIAAAKKPALFLPLRLVREVEQEGTEQ